MEIDTKSAESLVDKLASLELTDDEAAVLLGVFQQAVADDVDGFSYDKQSANQDQIAMFVVKLYVDQMKLKLND